MRIARVVSIMMKITMMKTSSTNHSIKKVKLRFQLFCRIRTEFNIISRSHYKNKKKLETAEPVAVAIQVQLQDQVLLELVAAVVPVGQLAAAVDLAVVEMEQIVLVAVVIADRLTAAEEVVETGTLVVDQVVLEL